MSYAEGRIRYDADSHLELSDWLVTFADPGVRDRTHPLRLGGCRLTRREGGSIEMMNG